MTLPSLYVFFFFFNDTATTEIYTLSLHDALPISAAYSGLKPRPTSSAAVMATGAPKPAAPSRKAPKQKPTDRKSTRLNSSHGYISYAVFCLKKKKTTKLNHYPQHTHFDIVDRALL